MNIRFVRFTLLLNLKFYRNANIELQLRIHVKGIIGNSLFTVFAIRNDETVRKLRSFLPIKNEFYKNNTIC